MEIFSKSRTKEKDYIDVTVKITFEDDINITKDLIKGIKQELKEEREGFSNIKINKRFRSKELILKLRYRYPKYIFIINYEPNVVSVRNDLTYIADKYEFNFIVIDKKGNESDYQCSPKSYAIYYEEVVTEERVVYIDAKNADEAREKFNNGEWDCGEYVETLDSYTECIIDIEEE